MSRQVKSVRVALNALKQGATIRIGQWGVAWWLTMDGARNRRPLLNRVFRELCDDDLIERVDDRKTRIGEEWGLKQ